MTEDNQPNSTFKPRWDLPTILAIVGIPLAILLAIVGIFEGKICSLSAVIKDRDSVIKRQDVKIYLLEVDKKSLESELGRLRAENESLKHDLENCKQRLGELGVRIEPPSLTTLPIPLPAGVEVEIRFGQVPPPGGGSESRGNISGIVRGIENPQLYKIVIYAQTDHWYVQPLVDAPFTDIQRDGKWSNWTHLGNRYAAVLVRSSYRPPAVTDALPNTGEDVLVVVSVPASTPAK